MALSCRGVSARYREKDAPLRGVSLDVAPGELISILGPNGAGKSTLLRVLAGALAPHAGDVRLDDTPLVSLDRRAIARAIAFVTQTETVAFGFRVSEVVMMGRAPHQGAWMRASEKDAAIVDDAIARCDLDALRSRPVHELSGGEQKRVAIARALAQEPRVLLLDEPAAFLDVKHQIALHEMLHQEVSRRKLACVVVMHDLNAAAQYASRVVLMKDGEAISIGTVADVMTYARLKETFEADLYVGVNELTGDRFFLPMRRAPAREASPDVTAKG
jgi:iron complex transport system ATP-binding protein